MKASFIFAGVITCNLCLFLFGNIIYSNIVNTALINRILISEFCFIALYSLTDYANARFGIRFALFYIPLLAVFYLKFFLVLFYSINVQILSISIAILGSLVNFSIFRVIYNKLNTAVFSSRISTITTSLIEVSVFSYFLEIGVKGALITIFVRICYTYFITLILFKKTLRTI